VVVDIEEGKLGVARRLGADITVNSAKEDVVARVKEITGGIGADVVVEAAGSESSFNAASELVRHNGIFVFYSWVTSPIKLNISRWHDDGLEFRNTCLVHHTRQQREVWTPWALRPVRKGLIDTKSLVTHRFRLDQIKEAFEVAVHDETAIKVVLEP
jgi:L-iditol 2-dehydrogenase